MTDRERFEVNAKAHGVKILASEPTYFTFVATDGIMIITYLFSEDGNFIDKQAGMYYNKNIR